MSLGLPGHSIASSCSSSPQSNRKFVNRLWPRESAASPALQRDPGSTYRLANFHGASPLRRKRSCLLCGHARFSSLTLGRHSHAAQRSRPPPMPERLRSPSSLDLYLVPLQVVLRVSWPVWLQILGKLTFSIRKINFFGEKSLLARYEVCCLIFQSILAILDDTSSKENFSKYPSPTPQIETRLIWDFVAEYIFLINLYFQLGPFKQVFKS